MYLKVSGINITTILQQEGHDITESSVRCHVEWWAAVVVLHINRRAWGSIGQCLKLCTLNNISGECEV